MSEEEIKEVFENVFLANRFSGVYTSIDIIIEAMKSLLKLYEKEKEKNEELDKIKFIVTDKLPPDMKYVCYCNTDFERLFGSDYISKDKIREVLLDNIRYRQFELQQEYKNFKDDIKLNTLQDIKDELLEEE